MKFKLIENINSKHFIFLYHGWGGTVNNNQNLIQMLNRLGYNIVLPELKFHDTRSPIDNYFDQTNMNNYFWQSIFSSIDEFDQLKTELNLEYENIIVAGISMGGFISSGILKKYPQIKGMICINGSGSFLKSENIFRKNNNRKPLSDEEINLFHSYDPILKTPYNNYILLMHGEIDKIVPIDGAKHFHNKQIRSDALNTKFIIYENINHTVEDIMLNDILNWLKEVNE